MAGRHVARRVSFGVVGAALVLVAGCGDDSDSAESVASSAPRGDPGAMAIAFVDALFYESDPRRACTLATPRLREELFRPEGGEEVDCSEVDGVPAESVDLPAAPEPTVEVESESVDSAVVVVAYGEGDADRLELVRVDGTWLVESLAAN